MPTALFSSEAVQALLLGSRWRAERGEEPLAAAAREALAKIAALLPVELAQELDA
jgi:predicted DNA-binding transcriptional regulator YafY